MGESLEHPSNKRKKDRIIVFENNVFIIWLATLVPKSFKVVFKQQRGTNSEPNAEGTAKHPKHR